VSRLPRRQPRTKSSRPVRWRGDWSGERGPNVVGVVSLVLRHQPEIVLGRTVGPRAEVAAVIEGGDLQAVEEGQHLRVGSFELRTQLLGRTLVATSKLAGVPAIGVEVSRYATLAGSHPAQGGHEARFRGGQMNKQVAHHPASVARTCTQPILRAHAIKRVQECTLRVDEVRANGGFAIGGHAGRLGPGLVGRQPAGVARHLP